MVNNPQDNIQTEKNDSTLLFSNNLVNVLNMGTEENYDLLDIYNTTLVKIIIEDQEFQKELEHALYKNLEKITHKTFKLDNKLHTLRPTIRV